MPDTDKVLCVQVFGLIEMEPGKHAFGFARTYAMPPQVSPLDVDEALLRLGAVKIEKLPIEWE